MFCQKDRFSPFSLLHFPSNYYSNDIELFCGTKNTKQFKNIKMNNSYDKI